MIAAHPVNDTTSSVNSKNTLQFALMALYKIRLQIGTCYSQVEFLRRHGIATQRGAVALDLRSEAPPR